ncbi:hypothetical protein ACIBJD_29455 [Kitasatospora sp. NPDC050467]|uniref:hypothetical protein n=1 Tax=Kitasatospora sp. NPDC050467 TaxID=3364053 RepID=UPI0037BBC730
MLGDQIAEIQSQDTVRRVLAGGEGPVVEVSFQGTGEVLGTPVTEFATYESELHADGTLFGEGQGVDMTADGQTITWHGSGVGHFTEGGGVSYRGSVYFTTASPQFSRLNGTAGVFEFESGADGKNTAKVFEWK